MPSGKATQSYDNYPINPKWVFWFTVAGGIEFLAD